MSKLPEHVVIGPVRYAVTEVKDLHTTDADGVKQWLYGHIVYADAAIKLSADQDAAMQTITLWHEALHAILHQAGIEDHPEQIIQLLGYSIVSLLRDNPALIAATLENGDE